MKREITQPEWAEADKAAKEYSLQRYGTGTTANLSELKTAYRCGYIAALSGTVPGELVQEMADALAYLTHRVSVHANADAFEKEGWETGNAALQKFTSLKSTTNEQD